MQVLCCCNSIQRKLKAVQMASHIWEATGWVALQVLGRILGYADAEVAPEDFPVAPAAAIPKALAAAGVSAEQVGGWP